MFTRLATIVVASLCTVAACAGEAPTGAGGHGTGGGGGGGGGTGSGGGEGSGSGSGSSGGGGMTATQFLTQMDMKYCDEAFTCKASFPTDQGVTFDQAFGTSASQCYSESDAQVMPAQVEAEITAGKIHFDSAAAASCVSGLTFPACATFWSAGPTYPAACANALVGTVADGGACVVDFDCSNAMSICDATTHKCGPDTSGGTGARTAPADGPTLRSVLRM